MQGYTPPNAAANDYQSIPLDKIEDFGVHANAYYQLKVSVFKSSLDTKLLDLLWNKYWVNTLSQSQIVTVSTARCNVFELLADDRRRDQSREYTLSQVKDLNAKLTRIGGTVGQPRNDLYSSVTHKKVERKDKGKTGANADDQGDEHPGGRILRSSKDGDKEGEVGGEGSTGKEVRWEVKDTQLTTTAKDG